jgi:hypothetical protein
MKLNVGEWEKECKREKEHLFLLLPSNKERMVTRANVCTSMLVSSSSEQDQPWKSFTYSFFAQGYLLLTTKWREVKRDLYSRLSRLIWFI